MKRWNPILRNDHESLAWSYISKLADDIQRLEKQIKEQRGYLVAPINCSIFCHYLYKVSQDRRYLKSGQFFLHAASIGKGIFGGLDQLYGGKAKLAWALEHLDSKREHRGNQELDRRIRQKIQKASRAPGSLRNYGLCDDWVGYGVYGLERWPRSKATIGSLIHLFSTKARTNTDGAAWFTAKNAFPLDLQRQIAGGGYDLGVSHGNAGVVGFLAAALRFDSENRCLRDLLQESVRWILAQDEGIPFRSFAPKNFWKGKKAKPGRLAWCYGDLGMSAVLLSAGNVLEDTDVIKKAIDIGKRAGNLSNHAAAVSEPTLCHGAFGAFHVFNRLYQHTADRDFLRFSKRWAQLGFKMLRQEDSADNGWYPFGELDFLNGRVGIGLSLLAGVSGVEPSWDRLMLLGEL